MLHIAGLGYLSQPGPHTDNGVRRTSKPISCPDCVIQVSKQLTQYKSAPDRTAFRGSAAPTPARTTAEPAGAAPTTVSAVLKTATTSATASRAPAPGLGPKRWRVSATLGTRRAPATGRPRRAAAAAWLPPPGREQCPAPVRPLPALARRFRGPAALSHTAPWRVPRRCSLAPAMRCRLRATH